MAPEGFRIDLLGTSFSIKADQDPEYLKKLIDRYRRVAEDVRSGTGLSDSLKISIVAGILLCDELEKSRAKPQPGGDETERIALDLIERLDKAVRG